MTNNFVVKCPAMPARNTGWTATSDRLTDELRCPFDLPMMFGRSLACVAVFPPSRVTFQSPGAWEVEALVRPSDPSKPDKSVKVYDAVANMLIGKVEFPAEPVLRRGRHMEAQLIVSLRGAVDLDDLHGDLTVTLPVVLADAFPWYRGGALFGYTVRAVDCPASVEWQD